MLRLTVTPSIRISLQTQSEKMQSQALTWAKRRFICFVGYVVRGGTRTDAESKLRSGGFPGAGTGRRSASSLSSDFSGSEYEITPISEEEPHRSQFSKCKLNPFRFRGFIDCDSVSVLDEIKGSDVDVKEEIDPKIVKDDNSRIGQNVQNTAIKFLAARAFSASALRDKLIAKKFPVKIIDMVMGDMQGRGLLNDSDYAESFARSRWLSLSWGPRKIERALVEKGISEEDASKAAREVFMDEEASSENSDGMHHLGMSEITMDRLFDHASKHWLKGRDKSLENRRSGMVRWLQYRGFDWGVTKYILKKLELEHPFQ